MHRYLHAHTQDIQLSLFTILWNTSSYMTQLPPPSDGADRRRRRSTTDQRPTNAMNGLPEPGGDGFWYATDIPAPQQAGFNPLRINELVGGIHTAYSSSPLIHCAEPDVSDEYCSKSPSSGWHDSYDLPTSAISRPGSHLKSDDSEYALSYRCYTRFDVSTESCIQPEPFIQ